jgi:putative protease
MNVTIGTITHYYDKIGVAVVEVKNHGIAVGDTVKISGHDNEFLETVASLEIDHTRVDRAGQGDSVGMKVSQRVRAGDVVYLPEIPDAEKGK